MWESFFGFKKTPFSDSPDAKQLFASLAWNQVIHQQILIGGRAQRSTHRRQSAHKLWRGH